MVWTQGWVRTVGKLAPGWVWDWAGLCSSHTAKTYSELHEKTSTNSHWMCCFLLFFRTTAWCAAWHEICQSSNSSGMQPAFWTSQPPPLQWHNSSKEENSTVTAGTGRDISRERDHSRTRNLVHGKEGREMQGLHSCCTREEGRQAQWSQWPACHLLWTKMVPMVTGHFLLAMWPHTYPVKYQWQAPLRTWKNVGTSNGSSVRQQCQDFRSRSPHTQMHQRKGCRHAKCKIWQSHCFPWSSLQTLSSHTKTCLCQT